MINHLLPFNLLINFILILPPAYFIFSLGRQFKDASRSILLHPFMIMGGFIVLFLFNIFRHFFSLEEFLFLQDGIVGLIVTSLFVFYYSNLSLDKMDDDKKKSFLKKAPLLGLVVGITVSRHPIWPDFVYSLILMIFFLFILLYLISHRHRMILTFRSYIMFFTMTVLIQLMSMLRNLIGLIYLEMMMGVLWFLALIFLFQSFNFILVRNFIVDFFLKEEGA